jgi:hypothetical protein
MGELIIKIKKFLLPKEDDIYLNINIWRLLFYINLFVYGFYGALVSKDIFVFLIITLFTVLTQSVFSLIEKRNLSDSVIQINFNSRTIVFFTLLLLIVCYKFLNNSLIGDELSYTQSALRHSLLIGNLIINKIILFDTIEFKYIILAINIIISVICIITIRFLNSLDFFKRLIISIIFMLFLRGLIFNLGGNVSPHPPLNHIFTFIISSVFPLSNFSIRLSYLLAFSIFTFSVYYLIKLRWPNIYSFLITCIIVSIPPLLHLGFSVETSLFTTCLFSYILLYFVIKDNIDYKILILIVSIFTLARISSVIILLPIFIYYIKNVNKKNYSNISCYLKEWAPILLFLPFLIPSVIKGTPATDYSVINVRIFEKYIAVFKSNIFWNSLSSVIPLFWIIFLPFSFLKKGKNYFHSLNYLFTFLTLVALFYSLKPHLWGNEKYQDEMFIPFIIVGFIQIFNFISSLNFKPLFNSTLLIFILFLNLFVLGKNRHIIENSNINKDYPYTQAYNYIHSVSGRDSSLSIGLTYGVMPEIINGYTSLNYKKALEIYTITNQQLFSNNSKDLYKNFVEKVNENKNLRYIILGLTSDKKLFTDIMINNNWTLDKTFEGSDPAFTIEILKKNFN